MYSHHGTPTKAKVQEAIEFCDRMRISYQKKDVFRTFNVGHIRGWEMLQPSSSSRRLVGDENREKTRDRKSLINPLKIREMQRLLKKEGIEARALTWQQLGYEVGLNCSGRTVQRIMKIMDYHKCISCKKGWVNDKTATQRVIWSQFMLNRYSVSDDGDRVRFSDEVHYEWSSAGKLRIIRKPDQRYCQDCIQEEHQPDEKDQKRHHCSSAVGNDFKSDMHFYNVSGNTNGKMSQKVYIDQILKPIVKPWLMVGHDFALGEDGDSGHEPGKHNIVRTWKEKHCLDHYFNCPLSPDLSSIENCWQPVKQQLYKYPHWDNVTTKELILEEWSHVTQSFINERVRSMPDRLKACIEGDGKMTDY